MDRVEPEAGQIMDRDPDSADREPLVRAGYITLRLFGLPTFPPRHSLLLLSNEALRGRYGLSPAECRVARLITAGRSNREIADALGIRPKTAGNHTSRILAKLEARSRAEVGPKLRGERE